MSAKRSGRIARLGSIGLVAVAVAGCASLVPYQPNATVIDKMGLEEARAKLSEMLTRAVQPLITSAEVDDNRIHMAIKYTTLGMFYTTQEHTRTEDISFANVDRIEIYSNHMVFVWKTGNQITKILFSSEEEARTFADYLASFMARRKARS